MGGAERGGGLQVYTQLASSLCPLCARQTQVEWLVCIVLCVRLPPFFFFAKLRGPQLFGNTCEVLEGWFETPTSLERRLGPPPPPPPPPPQKFSRGGAGRRTNTSSLESPRHSLPGAQQPPVQNTGRCAGSTPHLLPAGREGGREGLRNFTFLENSGNILEENTGNFSIF